MKKSTLLTSVISLAGLLVTSSCKDSNSVQIPSVSKQLAKRDRTLAMSNARQIHLAMIEFDQMHRQQPGEKAQQKIAGSKAESANDCFRQYIQSGVVKSEAIFYAASNFSQKPDGDIGNKNNNYKQACAKGEVGFVYIDAPDAKNRAPLIAAPLLDADTGKFDHKKYGGKAVVLNRQGVVSLYDIDEKTGKIMKEVGGNKIDILSVENKQFRSAPKIKYPEPK